MKKHYSLPCRIFLLLFFLFSNRLVTAQQLGIYSFSGAGICPNQNPTVTSQPPNALFDDYKMVGVTCSSGSDVFSSSHWNTTALMDAGKYYQLTIRPANCFSLDLNQLQFSHRVSTSGGTPVIHVRSNRDGFTADLYSVSPPPGIAQVETIVLGPDFSSIADSVVFRFYITGMSSTGATYRHDNVSVSGVTNTISPGGFYADADADGYGDAAVTVIACSAPPGYVTDNTDCDDANSTVNPASVWYADADHDGVGNSAVSMVQCHQPMGYVLSKNDCDDTNPGITGATIVYYADSDGDGFGNPATGIIACANPSGYVLNNNDCDDNNNAVGIASTMYYQDLDGDGFGNSTSDSVACSQPIGYVADHTDCDDINAAIHPLAAEIPNNGIDEDCSGADSVVATKLAIYQFTGNTCAAPLVAVNAQPVNALFSDYTSVGTKCGNAAGVFSRSGWNTGVVIDLAEYTGFTISPSDCYGLSLSQLSLLHRASSSAGTPTIHIRSSLDNYTTDIFTKQLTVPAVNKTDTINLPAEFSAISGPVSFRIYVVGVTKASGTYRNDNVWVSGFVIPLSGQNYYADLDGDGFGDPAVDSVSCNTPIGFVSNSADCNDHDSLQKPSSVWYQDLDADGFGNPSVSVFQCQPPAGYVSEATDCDDTNSGIGDPITWFADADNDGFGNFGVDSVSCSIPAGYVADHSDCDDTNPAILNAGDTYYPDADGDGYGKSGSAGVIECSMPAGYSPTNDDCDDANPAIYPAAADVSGNDIDENCDGIDGSLGLLENQEFSATIFPNPGTDNVSFILSGNWNAEPRIRICAIDGKEVLRSGSLVFSTAELLPGTYLVHVTDGVHRILLHWVKI